MPDEALLAEMYGPEYLDSFAGASPTGEDRDFSGPLAVLERQPRGRFIDYGCGDGALVRAAATLGWDALGVEFDGAVAARVSARTGLRVVGIHAAAMEPPADVVHLGDVIEHLTDVDRQLPAILRLVKPGGLLLAQGPLEAHANVFTWVLHLARLVRRTPSSIPPYHVVLATATGQRRLFTRCQLQPIDFVIREVAWPAPARLGIRDATQLRVVALYALRKASQAVTRLTRGRWGNRYFYAGRLTASSVPS
jgi:SAM-dependent methyltransferase